MERNQNYKKQWSGIAAFNAMFPDSILLSRKTLMLKDLSLCEKMLLSWFIQFGPTKPDWEELSRTLQRRVTVLQRNIRELVEKGYLREIANDGRGKIYEFTECFDYE